MGEAGTLLLGAGVTMVKNGASASRSFATAALVGFLCVVVAVSISAYEIYQHLRNFEQPQFQLHVVRIIGMVPVYSITSYTALMITSDRHALLLDCIRDCYEAYVIYNFLVLLIQYGGGERQLVTWLEMLPRVHHVWPLSEFLPPMQLGMSFLVWVRASCLQFVFVKPAGSFFRWWAFNNLDGLNFTRAEILVYIANNASVSCALYGLVTFYMASKSILAPFRPFLKFAVVKMVIFFSFWQGVALSVAIKLGVLRDVEGFSAKEQATSLQDLLICMEMVVASVCHWFIFSWREHSKNRTEENGSGESRPLLRNFGDVVDFRDVFADAKDTLYGNGYERELRESEPYIPEIMWDLEKPGSESNAGVYQWAGEPLISSLESTGVAGEKRKFSLELSEPL